MTSQERPKMEVNPTQAAQDALAGAVVPELQAARRQASTELAAAPPEAPAKATRLFAKLLDDLVQIPGTNTRVGVDPLLSLIPGAGTAVGASFGAVILIDAIRLRAPISVLARMGANLLLDWLLGLLPVIGAFFDIAYRSNRRNLRLLNRTIENRELVRRASIQYWLAALVLLVLIMVVIVAVPIALLLGFDALVRSFAG